MMKLLLTICLTLCSICAYCDPELQSVSPLPSANHHVVLETVAVFNFDIDKQNSLFSFDTLEAGDTIFLKLYYTTPILVTGHRSGLTDTVDLGIPPAYSKLIIVEMFDISIYPNDTDTVFYPPVHTIFLPLAIRGYNKEEDNVHLYPNPTSGIFTVAAQGGYFKNHAAITIMNTIGQVVYQDDVKIAGRQLYYQANLRHLPRGIYLLTLSDGDRTRTLRLMKE